MMLLGYNGFCMGGMGGVGRQRCSDVLAKCRVDTSVRSIVCRTRIGVSRERVRDEFKLINE